MTLRAALPAVTVTSKGTNHLTLVTAPRHPLPGRGVAR